MNIEQQIEEARAERDAIGKALDMECRDADNMNALNRLWLRARDRLATLEAVRDGRMVEVTATASVDQFGRWAAYGHHHFMPLHPKTLEKCNGGADGETLSILRGYAHVPSTQVHEVEADSEVPS